MMLKLEHDLGIENLTLLKRRRGCGGIPKLLVLSVLVFSFLLIMSCLTPNKRNIFISLILLVPAKRLVSENR
jgi:hypothetical protein